MNFLELPQSTCLKCNTHLTKYRKKFEDLVDSGESRESAINQLGLVRMCCLKSLHVVRFFVPESSNIGSISLPRTDVLTKVSLGREGLVSTSVTSYKEMNKKQKYEIVKDESGDEDESESGSESESEKKGKGKGKTKQPRISRKTPTKEKTEKEKTELEKEKMEKEKKKSEKEKKKSEKRLNKKIDETRIFADPDDIKEIEGLTEPDQRKNCTLITGNYIVIGWSRDEEGKMEKIPIGNGKYTVRLRTVYRKDKI